MRLVARPGQNSPGQPMVEVVEIEAAEKTCHVSSSGMHSKHENSPVFGSTTESSPKKLDRGCKIGMVAGGWESPSQELHPGAANLAAVPRKRVHA
jgi:hypothetical protein